jgi:hypothetical protein
MTQNKFNVFTLSANPHYYDYFHTLKFGNDRISFADGAGQRINTFASGKFIAKRIDEFSTELDFYDIIELNPYDSKQKIRDIDRFKVMCKREEGIFALWQEAGWHVADEEDNPCLLTEERYIFDLDPLSFGINNQQENLYYKIENKDFSKSLLIYYDPDKTHKLTLRELKELGINREIIKMTSSLD